jgi:hypothetical protein
VGVFSIFNKRLLRKTHGALMCVIASAQAESPINLKTCSDFRDTPRNHAMPPRAKSKLPPPIPGVVEIGPFTMKEGQYYVGDLFNVLTEKEREEVSDKIGQFTLKSGRVVVNFNLPYGDGLYPDSNGRHHFIDSGTIGLTLSAGLIGLEAGHTVDYKDKFACMSAEMDHPSKGLVAFIYFGEDVDINTEDQLGGVAQLVEQSLKYVK